jgi:hypothetical protein
MWIAISNAIGSRQPVGGGAPPDPGYTPPLDTYTGATAAYSVRKLSSSYSGSCIEAYRVSDGATQDIGFDGDGLIDTAAIISFASGGEVRVRTWYDQSGNASDAVQTTASQMPQIYDGASVITQNAKPTIKFILASNTALDMGTLPDFSSNYLGASVSTTTVSNQLCYIYNTNTDYSTHGVSAFHENGKAAISSAVTGSSGGKIAATATTNNQVLHIGQLVSGTLSLFTDGTEETASTSWAPGTGNFIGRRSDGQFDMDGNIQEIVLWNTDESSIRTGLEINLNDYFQIANLPATSSGLLYDYPGAAAAYSVRSLSNNAIKCMRVRRTVSPFDEQDIGFDSNGDLDTAALAAFGGSDPLTVSAWYDQSGQSRDATQSTAGSQPIIYDGSAVITENGKPAIDFVQNSSRSLNGPTFSNNSIMSFSVNREVTNRGTIWGLGGGNMYKILEAQNWSNVQLLIFKGDGTNYDSATSTATRDFAQHLITVSRFSNALKAYIDGISEIDTTDTYAASSGALGFGNRNTQGQLYLQEAVFYESDQSTNRTGIESNINTYFSIY